MLSREFESLTLRSAFGVSQGSGLGESLGRFLLSEPPLKFGE